MHTPVEAPWLADYLHELAMFPNSKHWDQIDSTSEALAQIHSPINAAGWLGLAEEYLAAKEALASQQGLASPTI